jgi:hypothetical protein
MTHSLFKWHHDDRVRIAVVGKFSVGDKRIVDRPTFEVGSTRQPFRLNDDRVFETIQLLRPAETVGLEAVTGQPLDAISETRSVPEPVEVIDLVQRRGGELLKELLVLTRQLAPFSHPDFGAMLTRLAIWHLENAAQADKYYGMTETYLETLFDGRAGILLEGYLRADDEEYRLIAELLSVFEKAGVNAEARSRIAIGLPEFKRRLASEAPADFGRVRALVSKTSPQRRGVVDRWRIPEHDGELRALQFDAVFRDFRHSSQRLRSILASGPYTAMILIHVFWRMAGGDTAPKAMAEALADSFKLHKYTPVAGERDRIADVDELNQQLSNQREMIKISEEEVLPGLRPKLILRELQDEVALETYTGARHPPTFASPEILAEWLTNRATRLAAGVVKYIELDELAGKELTKFAGKTLDTIYDAIGQVNGAFCVAASALEPLVGIAAEVRYRLEEKATTPETKALAEKLAEALKNAIPGWRAQIKDVMATDRAEAMKLVRTRFHEGLKECLNAIHEEFWRVNESEAKDRIRTAKIAYDAELKAILDGDRNAFVPGGSRFVEKKADLEPWSSLLAALFQRKVFDITALRVKLQALTAGEHLLSLESVLGETRPQTSLGALAIIYIIEAFANDPENGHRDVDLSRIWKVADIDGTGVIQLEELVNYWLNIALRYIALFDYQADVKIVRNVVEAFDSWRGPVELTFFDGTLSEFLKAEEGPPAKLKHGLVASRQAEEKRPYSIIWLTKQAFTDKELELQAPNDIEESAKYQSAKSVLSQLADAYMQANTEVLASGLDAQLYTSLPLLLVSAPLNDPIEQVPFSGVVPIWDVPRTWVSPILQVLAGADQVGPIGDTHLEEMKARYPKANFKTISRGTNWSRAVPAICMEPAMLPVVLRAVAMSNLLADRARQRPDWEDWYQDAEHWVREAKTFSKDFNQNSIVLVHKNGVSVPVNFMNLFPIRKELRTQGLDLAGPDGSRIKLIPPSI